MPNAGDPGFRRGRYFDPSTFQPESKSKLSETLANMDDEDREALEREINRIMVKNLEEAMMRVFLRGLERERKTSYLDIPVVIDYSLAPNTFRIAEPKKDSRYPTYLDKRRELVDLLLTKPQSLAKGIFN